jgi:hypothetical protein
MRRLTRCLAALAACASVACTPALNWREVRPEGSQAQLMFPCKPASHMRRVTLAGREVEMSMFACTAGEVSYVLTFADLQDPASVAPALDELGHAARAHLQLSAAASSPLSVPGMTPSPRAALWQIEGRLPDGRAVVERAAMFSYGTKVYQATAIGARLDGEALETFFGALRVGG